MSIIPAENIAIFLQKFTVTSSDAVPFFANYNSVGIVTTNVPGNRQWQFTFDGSFVSETKFEIIYDFSQVETFGYSILFEGNLSGFVTVDGRIYASDRYLKYIPQTPQDIANKIVRLRFKPPCPRTTSGARSLYYMVTLNDGSSDCATTVNVTKPSLSTTIKLAQSSTWSVPDTTGSTVAEGTVSYSSDNKITTIAITTVSDSSGFGLEILTQNKQNFTFTYSGALKYMDTVITLWASQVSGQPTDYVNSTISNLVNNTYTLYIGNFANEFNCLGCNLGCADTNTGAVAPNTTVFCNLSDPSGWEVKNGNTSVATGTSQNTTTTGYEVTTVTFTHLSSSDSSAFGLVFDNWQHDGQAVTFTDVSGFVPDARDVTLWIANQTVYYRLSLNDLIATTLYYQKSCGCLSSAPPGPYS